MIESSLHVKLLFNGRQTRNVSVQPPPLPTLVHLSGGPARAAVHPLGLCPRIVLQMFECLWDGLRCSVSGSPQTATLLGGFGEHQNKQKHLFRVSPPGGTTKATIAAFWCGWRVKYWERLRHIKYP